MTEVYRVTDGNEFEFFGDVDDIVNWIYDVLIRDKVVTEKELKEKGWVYCLEQDNLTFEEIYNKD